MARRKRRDHEGPRPTPRRRDGVEEVVDTPEGPVPRRTLLELGLGACGAIYLGAIAYPIHRYLSAPARRSVEAGAVREVLLTWDEVPPVGEAVVFRFGTRPAMLIRRAERDFVCLDAVCTHMGCTVRFQPERDRIHCACHGGVFDPETGAPRAGPPPRALARHRVEVRDAGLAITRA